MRELNGVRMGDRQVKIEFAKNKGKNAAPGSTMAGTGRAGGWQICGRVPRRRFLPRWCLGAMPQWSRPPRL